SVRLLLDDSPELTAIVRHEADAVDDEVIDLPTVRASNEAIIHRHAVSLLGDDRARDLDLIAFDPLLTVQDLLSLLVGLDVVDVRPLEQIGEQLDELGALGGCALVPVAAHALPRHLLEPEAARDDLPDARTALLFAQAFVAADLEHLVDGLANQVRRLA